MRLDTPVTGLILLIMLSACDAPSPEPSRSTSISPKPPAGIAASYTGGQLSLEAIENEFATARTPACVQARSAPGGGSTETLIPCYRELAEALAIEDIVLGGLSDVNQALQELDDNYVEQRNAALLRAYYGRVAEQIEVNDAEIEAMLASGETYPETVRLVEKRTSVQVIPDSAILLSPSQLVRKLDAGIPDLLIFDLGGQQLTVTEFRNMTGLDPTQAVIDLPQDRQDRIQEAYLKLKQRRLLILSLLESGDVVDRELLMQVEESLHKERLKRLVAANFEFYTENVRELFLPPGGNRDLLDVVDTP